MTGKNLASVPVILHPGRIDTSVQEVIALASVQHVDMQKNRGVSSTSLCKYLPPSSVIMLAVLNALCHLAISFLAAQCNYDFILCNN
jgi:hypothetical protein